MAGTAIAPISRPISRLDSAKDARNVPISGGTAKNVIPTAKKLSMALARMRQRRTAISGRAFTR